MAQLGAKRRVEENKKRLQLLQLLISIANALHVFLRLLIFRSSISSTHYFGLIFTSLIYLVSYRGISFSAGIAAALRNPDNLLTHVYVTVGNCLLAATYGPKGELLDGGADLNAGGLLEYYQDLIYLAAFVQTLSIVSDWFWLVMLLAPGYASWLLWRHVLQPYVFAPKTKDIPLTDEERRHRERAEKRAQRRAVKHR